MEVSALGSRPPLQSGRVQVDLVTDFCAGLGDARSHRHRLGVVPDGLPVVDVLHGSGYVGLRPGPHVHPRPVDGDGAWAWAGSHLEVAILTLVE